MQQKWQVIHGDALDVLTKHEIGTFDASFSDPPYGISFMGRGWDRGVPSPDVWRAVMAACRPGANVVAFGGTRTWHRLAVAMEDSGMEMRDSIISWMYGSGWPKPADVSKHIDKLFGAQRVVIGDSPYAARKPNGSAGINSVGGSPSPGCKITAPATPDAERFHGYHANLKPAWEPALMFRVPMPGSLARNALDHGVAGLNVDGARIEASGWPLRQSIPGTERKAQTWAAVGSQGCRAMGSTDLGRWPANVVLCCPCEGPHEPGCPVYDLDEQSGWMPSSGGIIKTGSQGRGRAVTMGNAFRTEYQPRDDDGGASRFFYVAKVSASERGTCAHPCMKPIELCRHIATLLLPPPRADGKPRRLLVPFSGSGSEMIGALQAGWDEVVGIELDPDNEGWVDFSLARIAREMLAWRERRGEIKAENAPEIRGVQLGLFAG